MGTEKEYYALTKKAFDFLAPFYNLMSLLLATHPCQKSGYG